MEADLHTRNNPESPAVDKPIFILLAMYSSLKVMGDGSPKEEYIHRRRGASKAMTEKSMSGEVEP